MLESHCEETSGKNSYVLGSQVDLRPALLADGMGRADTRRGFSKEAEH